MTQRDQSKNENNLILFPNLEKRLLEKGLEQLQRKNFTEAIKLLGQASQLNPDDEDINLGLVVANFEAGNLEEAKQRAKKMLQLGIGDYFTIVDMYIMILVQQNNYAEVVATIEALLEEREVPADKLEHFTKMLQFSRKMSNTNSEHTSAVQSQPMEELSFDLFSITDPGEQVHLAGRLASSNVRAYITEINAFLSSNVGDPFFKTILLTVLKEQDYIKEVIVRKYGKELAVVPTEIFEVHAHPDLLACLDVITDKLENTNPVLLDHIKQLMERYFFLTYPFRTEFGVANSWSAAFHYVALTYFGQEEAITEIADLYEVKQADVEKAIEEICKIDENSSP